eukprot:CAMPEP_0119101774 /NCGR_PEP_ID=MMETSP1180-20130426/732_1 /TAXON_ID=3052 ORGANISM="Chlamydomonas cf sp, Strain CCMP681" /NCGR_SAMPLE_ID=MMETSP1180 /ASSEMBLY_ACC=CAM_ASM_000741 /LENGTH=270 /DNA_ID=CAMNT_0007085943 /DNA_START=123 /DNA_END=935 /DNA_ORIENTATION=-
MPRPEPYLAEDLTGKIALITGASSGFGLAVSWRLAEAGMKLILVARRQERLDALAAELLEACGTITHVVCLDVRDTTKCENLVSTLPAEFQQVDLLINNAGLALGTASAGDNDISEMRTMLETNVLSVMALSKSVLKVMIPRNSGQIINVGSTAGHSAYPGGSGYTASKFALRAYTESMRMDLCATNIRISLISPGAVETEFSLVRFKGDEARAAKVYEGLAKLTAVDIADNILYMATRPARVQIHDLVVSSVHQASSTLTARPLQPLPQ